MFSYMLITFELSVFSIESEIFASLLMMRPNEREDYNRKVVCFDERGNVYDSSYKQ